MVRKPRFVPHKLTAHVKLLHKAAIIYQDKVLILKRSHNALSRPECWDLPGGNSEWPADLNHSTPDLYKLDIAREIFEETGLRVQPNIFGVDSMVHFSTYFNAGQQVYTIICGWLVKEIPEEKINAISISEEHTDMKWVRLSEIRKYNFGGKKGEFVAEIIKTAFQQLA